MVNEFTGIPTDSLHKKLAKAIKRARDLHKQVENGEELGGGSPFESVYDEINDLEQELKRRESS